MLDKPKGKSISEQKQMDKETTAMLFEGASLSQLVQLFGQDIRKIKAKLHGLEPIAIRSGHPIYSVKEAARRLVEPMWPIEEYIKHMNHADLPVLLKKEYWAGMRSKQIYEEAAGDLWRTDRVIEHLTEMLKTVSISLRLAADAVERETSLTVPQRNIIIRLMDETLSNCHRSLEENLSDREVTDGGDTVDIEDDEI